MMYMIGAVAFDTRPFSLDAIEIDSTADFAVHQVFGTRPVREFAGEGDETLSLSGRLFPSRVGGLSELESLQAMRREGRAVPVMRGDGLMLGWFVLTQIGAPHSDLDRDGIGFTIDYRLTLVRSDPSAASTGIIGALTSLFDAMGPR